MSISGHNRPFIAPETVSFERQVTGAERSSQLFPRNCQLRNFRSILHKLRMYNRCVGARLKVTSCAR